MQHTFDLEVQTDFLERLAAARPVQALAELTWIAALDTMFRALNYPSGAFINIGHDRTHAELYQGAYPGRIHTFAVWQIDGRTLVRHARHHDGHVIEEE